MTARLIHVRTGANVWILLEVIAVIANVDTLDSTVKKVNRALLLQAECYSSFGALSLDMTSLFQTFKSQWESTRISQLRYLLWLRVIFCDNLIHGLEMCLKVVFAGKDAFINYDCKSKCFIFALRIKVVFRMRKWWESHAALHTLASINNKYFQSKF